MADVPLKSTPTRRSDEPYPGIRPFEARDSRYFCGRGPQIEGVLACLAGEQRTAFVIGPSGCGKSSLIRAGVIPHLQALGLPDRGHVWLVTTCMPGRTPMANLRMALGKLIRDPNKRLSDDLVGREIESYLRSRRSVNHFLEDFREYLDVQGGEASGGVTTTFSEEATAVRRQEANLLILVDQFEEIFAGEGAPSNDAKLFVEIMAKAMTRPDAERIFLIPTMRTENLRELAAFPELPELLNRTLYYITAPGEADLEDIIVEPARRFMEDGTVEASGTSSHGQLPAPPYPFSPELVNLLLEQVAAIRHDPDHLPLLQHLLRALWLTAGRRFRAGPFDPRDHDKTIANSDLDAVVGSGLDAAARKAQPAGRIPRQALSSFAEGVYVAIPGNARALAEAFLQLLVDYDEGGFLKRRQTTRREVLDVAGRSNDRESAKSLERIIALYKAPHPLIRDHDDGRLDVAHEALLRNWGKFNEAAQEDRRAARGLIGMIEAYVEWQEAESRDHHLLSTQRLERWRVWGSSNLTAAWHRRHKTAFEGLVADGDPGSAPFASIDSAVTALREFWNRSEGYQASLRDAYPRRLKTYAVVGCVVLAILGTAFGFAVASTVRERLALVQGIAAHIATVGFQIKESMPGKLDGDDQTALSRALELAEAIRKLDDYYKDYLQTTQYIYVTFATNVIYFPYRLAHRLVFKHEQNDTKSDVTFFSKVVNLPYRLVFNNEENEATSDVSSTIDLAYFGVHFAVTAAMSSKTVWTDQLHSMERVENQPITCSLSAGYGNQTSGYIIAEGDKESTSQVTVTPVAVKLSGQVIMLGTLDEYNECRLFKPGTLGLPPGSDEPRFGADFGTAMIKTDLSAGSMTRFYYSVYRIDWRWTCSEHQGQSCNRRHLVPYAEPVPSARGWGTDEDLMPRLSTTHLPAWSTSEPAWEQEKLTSNDSTNDCEQKWRTAFDPPIWVCRLRKGDTLVEMEAAAGDDGLNFYEIGIRRARVPPGNESQSTTQSSLREADLIAPRINYRGAEPEAIQLGADDTLRIKLRYGLGFVTWHWHFDDIIKIACHDRRSDGEMPESSEPPDSLEKLKEKAERQLWDAGLFDGEPCSDGGDGTAQ